MSAKTEPATPRRLKRAREAGDIPLSALSTRAAAFAAGVAGSALLLDAARSRLPDLLRQAYRAPRSSDILEHAVLDWLTLTTPWLAVVAAFAASVALLQARGAIRFLAFDSARFNGARGIERLFDGPRWLATLSGSIAAAVIGAVTWLLLRAHLQSLANSSGYWRALAPLLGFFLRRLFYWAVGLALLAGLVDLWVVHRFWRERLRMTRYELRQELREMGADPELKSARARLRHELSLSNPLGLVASSTLIACDAEGLAVLLRYDGATDPVPTVLAVAQRSLAVSVSEEAQSLGIPTVQAPSLARRLARLAPGSPILTECYDEVAELLSALGVGNDRDVL